MKQRPWVGPKLGAWLRKLAANWDIVMLALLIVAVFGIGLTLPDGVTP